MATRRGFLALLGVGTVSAPLAAKAAADTEISKLCGIATDLGGGAVAPAGCAPSQAANGLKWLPYEERLNGLSSFVGAAGLPDFLRTEFLEEAKRVTSLDPDIACKRSWSMAAKIHEQRQRNFNRRLRQIHSEPVRYAKRSAFQKLLGFELPF